MGEASSKNLFPSYRIFIFGQEVTEDVVSVTLEESDGRYPNTCAITLVSKYDRYIVTPHDMIAFSLAGTIQAQAVINNVPVLDPIQAMMDPSDRSNVPIYGSLVPVDDEGYRMKKRVVSAKRSVPPVQFKPEATTAEPNPKSILALRYPFQAGKPIFHPNDPVRVFIRDPRNPNLWYHQFSGLVSDFTEELDANNNNSLTIVAETAAKWLRYGRFTANPGIVDIKQQVVQDVIVKDVAARTVFANLFNHLSLPEIFYAMLFGINAFGDSTNVAKILEDSRKTMNSPNPGLSDELSQRVEILHDRAYSVSAPEGAVLTRRKWGIGHLSLTKSRVFIFGDNRGPDSGTNGIPKGMRHVDITHLSDYQAQLDHRVAPADLISMRLDDKTTWPDQFKQTQDTSQIDDVIAYIGNHPEIYPTDGGRLMMLMPRSLGAARREIVTNDLIGSFNLNTEWTTRGEVLADVVERIQFVFYISPRGDFCVEFPLYDFMPEHFDSPTAATQKFGQNYIIGVDDTMQVSATFTDSKVITQAVCAPKAIYNYDNVPGNDVLNKAGQQQVVTLWHLIPLYGVRQVPIQPHGYISTTDAAKLYAAICLNKLNCEAYTQSVVMNPRFTAWINRPFYVQRRNHMGVTRSISHNITWGQSGDVSTRLGLGAMRGWDGTVDSAGRMVFTPIGGRAGRALMYDVLFQQRGAVAPNQSSKPPVKAEGQ